MAEWKHVKIGDVCTVERGGSPRPIDKFITDDPNGINWIKIGDTDDSMYITKTAQKIIPEGMKKSRYVQPGDFLLSNSMSFGHPYILKIDGCIHDGWLVLRDNDGIFDKRFLYYYLSSPSTYQKFKNMAVGGVVNNLNSEMVRGVTVPVPTMEEQLDIVSTLEKVTELIALRKEQLAKLDELVKSRFIELFGDPEQNPKGWPVVSITEIIGGKVSNGFFAKREAYRDDGNVQVLGVANIVNRMYSNIESLPRTNATQADEEKYAVKYGDMLFCRSSLVAEGIGKASIVPKGAPHNVLFECHVIRLPLDLQKCVPEFVQVLSTTDFFRRQIIAQSKTATMTTIGQDGIMKSMIILPPLEQQREFLRFVEQTDKSKLAIQQSLDKLELLKKSLMQQYFG